jgi:hypothetical protein
MDNEMTATIGNFDKFHQFLKINKNFVFAAAKGGINNINFIKS